jgi:hypothetical protein
MNFTETMEVWTQNATPGAEHKLLARFTGEWNVFMQSWIDPSQPPVESVGISRIQMMLDGRIRSEDYEGDATGIHYKGWGMTGFDNLTGKFWMTWADNMSTGLWCSHDGVLSADKKILTFTGTMNKAVGRVMGVKMKDIYRFISGDQFIFEAWEEDSPGHDRKTLEILYRRKSE